MTTNIGMHMKDTRATFGTFKQFYTTMLFFVCCLPVLLGGCAQSPEDQLQTFLNDNQASSDQREAYIFALEHSELLRYIPCYCGCVRIGHKSSYNCFMRERQDQGLKGLFDAHGLSCPMCVQIALRVEKLYEKGVSLPRIRDSIDQMYKSHPLLQPTLTPKPAKAG